MVILIHLTIYKHFLPANNNKIAHLHCLQLHAFHIVELDLSDKLLKYRPISKDVRVGTRSRVDAYLRGRLFDSPIYRMGSFSGWVLIQVGACLQLTYSISTLVQQVNRFKEFVL